MSAINPAYRASRHQKDGDRHGEGEQPRREKARSVDRARAPGRTRMAEAIKVEDLG
jgi:hypothetical protein